MSSKAGEGSLESKIVRWLAGNLPTWAFRRLPTYYYWLNKYRFKLFPRPVMLKETSKAKARRQREGFFEKYFMGQGLDVAYGGDKVVPNCRGWDIENGDAHELRGLADSSFDFVYSSHALEHLEDPRRALKSWWRVLKPGGYLILYLPERDLLERKLTLPSDVSLDHKHYFLLDRDESPVTMGIVPLINKELPGAEVVYQKICDAGYRRDLPFELMMAAEYSIEVVARKGA